MTTSARAAAPATRTDLDALPENVVGEIIEGVLYSAPRPRFRHASIESVMVADLVNPFQRGRGGPGGWWILAEPGIELPEATEIVPDMAGWRRSHLPDPLDNEPIRVVPDWVCEILSPTTRRHDQLVKRPFYARVGVPYLWIVDIEARSLSANELVEGRWLEIGLFGPGDAIRAKPFDGVELSMADWWDGGSETSSP